MHHARETRFVSRLFKPMNAVVDRFDLGRDLTSRLTFRAISKNGRSLIDLFYLATLATFEREWFNSSSLLGSLVFPRFLVEFFSSVGPLFSPSVRSFPLRK